MKKLLLVMGAAALTAFVSTGMTSAAEYHGRGHRDGAHQSHHRSGEGYRDRHHGGGLGDISPMGLLFGGNGPGECVTWSERYHRYVNICRYYRR